MNDTKIKSPLRVFGGQPTLFIGIDPGVNTGFAIWLNYEKYFISIDSMPIHTAMSVIKNIPTQAYYMHKFPDIIVRFEDARQRTWFGNAGREQLMGAGSIKRDCKIWEDYLTDLKTQGIITGFDMVAPKNNITKLNAQQFKRITGYLKPTNEHSRDAAMLVFER